MRKVLIISYYWPPSGGPGVQRWLKFAKYLPEFGIEPVMYTPSNPDYPIEDTALLEEVPNGIKVYQHRIFEPYRYARIFSGNQADRIRSGIIPVKRQSTTDRFLLWVRGNLFIPDARKFWVKPSVRYLENIAQKESFESIITTGPPHSVHLIGLELSRSLGIPWLADFRDPWTSIGYHKQLKMGPRARLKHQQLERTVLTTADTIVVTSATTKKEFERITTKPVVVITNGFDTGYEEPEPLDKSFTISHIGSLLSERNPTNLWEVLGELVRENTEFKERLRLKLIGVVGSEVLDSLYAAGLKDHVEVLPYVPHTRAIQYQKQAQVLLLPEINSAETKGILPGKLYEYLAAKRPILAIGPEEWEAATIVLNTGSGAAFDYEARADLKNVLLNWFNSYLSGTLEVKGSRIAQYSRRELTRNLANLLHGNRI